MTKLTSDTRIPRWIALGYAAFILAVAGVAAASFVSFERRGRAEIQDELARCAANAARLLEPAFRSLIEALPDRPDAPRSGEAGLFFGEWVAVSERGERLFPPAAAEDAEGDDDPSGMELVGEADRLAASGHQSDAIELYELSARTSTKTVRWNALLGQAAVYERTDRPLRAIPYLEQAAALDLPPRHTLAASLRRADVIARAADRAAAEAAYGAVLDALAGVAESWLTASPRPLAPEAVLMFGNRAAAGLQAIGSAVPPSTRARIAAALESRARVDMIAAHLATARPAGGFHLIASGAAEPVRFFARARPDGGREAFVLRWDRWQEQARAEAANVAVGRIPVAFDLALRGEEPREPALSSPTRLGSPPFDALILSVRFASQAALELEIGTLRLRLGLLIGAIAALFIAGAGIGAWNLARAARLARIRADFALATSHELKTPLTVIRAAAETLATRDLDPEARRAHLRTLVVESRRLSDLVARVLDLRRLEEGAGLAERSIQDLGELAREAVDAVEPMLAEAHMRCAVAAPAEPVPVLVDPEAIVNALLALLDNAIRYTPNDAEPERRTIEISVVRDGVRAAVEVADRGIGIPAEEREKVFEKYYRVRSPLFGRVRGAGLGLSIVRHIVEAHGGSVSIEGRSPAGTAVRISLPLAEEKDATAENPDRRG